MKLHSKRATALAALTLSCVAALTACGSDDGDRRRTAAPTVARRRVHAHDAAQEPRQPLLRHQHDGRREGGRGARRDTIEEVGPETGDDPDAQVPYINTAAQQGVDGLIVSANDPEAICDAIDEARDAGIKVVTFDSDTNPDCRDLFVNQATAEGIAAKQLELISEQIGGEGEIAILSAAPTRPTRTPGSR